MKKFFNLLLLLTITISVFSAFPLIAGATSGTCGENLSWIVDSNGTLIISGSGEMYDYSENSVAPWYEYRNQILNIVIENGATNVGERAFTDCFLTENVTLGNTIKFIDDYAFYDCALKSINIPSGVTSIGNSSFRSSGLTDITLPDTVTSVGEYAFFESLSLKTATLGQGLKTLGSNAFEYCKKLESITLPNSLTVIEEYTFHECWALTSLIIGNNITTINDFAFRSCKALDKIDIPDSVQYIGVGAFSYCINATAINIGSGVKTIANEAFHYCSSIESLDIPDSVTTLGTYVFSYCTSLKNANIGNGITLLDADLFYNCTSLSNVYVGNKVSNIYMAFFVCTNLTSIYIPKSVKNISDYSFLGCNNLSDIYYSGSKAEWDDINIGENNDALSTATIHYEFVEGITTDKENKKVKIVSYKEYLNVKLLAALYNGGKFSGQNSISVNIINGENVFDIPISDFSDADNLKIFVWESINSANPLFNFSETDLGYTNV